MIIKNLNEQDIIEDKKINSLFLSVLNRNLRLECKILKSDFFLDSFNYFPLTNNYFSFRKLFVGEKFLDIIIFILNLLVKIFLIRKRILKISRMLSFLVQVLQIVIIEILLHFYQEFFLSVIRKLI